MNWNDLYKDLNTINLVIVLIIGSCCNLFMEPSFTFAFLMGSLIMLINFHVMQKSIRSLFLESGLFIGDKMTLISKFYFRLAIIGIIIYILLGKNVDPIGLMLGLSIVMWGIIIMGIYYAIKLNRTKKGG